MTTAGTDRYLVAGFSSYTGNTYSSATYAGASMTAIKSSDGGSGNCVTTLFGLANPATGANNVIGYLAASNRVAGGAISFLNVHQTVPTSTFGTNSAGSASPFVAVSTSSGQYMIDNACVRISAGTLYTAGAKQTERFQKWQGEQLTIMGSNAIGTPSVTLTWAGVSHAWSSLGGNLLPANATAARLEEFKAERQGNRVALRWQTGFEVDDLGYHLHREQSGKRIRITTSPIAGSALIAGPGTPLEAGRTYSWSDVPASNDGPARYWLEEMTLDGKSTWHGPVSPGDAPARPIRSGFHPSATLKDLGVLAAPAETRPRPVKEKLRPQVRRSALTATVKRIKILVNRDGWYRVGQPDLTAAGLDPSVAPASLRLFREGKEYALRVNARDDSHFGAGDSIELYGTGLDTPFSDAAAYWLVAAEPGGRRVSLLPAETGSPTPDQSFTDVAETRPRTTYVAALLNGDKENFLGPTIGPTGLEVKIPIKDAEPGTPARLEVMVVGLTPVAHKIQVALNRVPLGEIAVEGQQTGRGIFPVAAGVNEGDNTVTLQSAGGEGDISLIDRALLEHRRGYRMSDGWLRFSTQGGQRVTVAGLDRPAARVFDITDPTSVEELSPAVAPVNGAAGAYSLTVTPPAAGARTLLAITDARPLSRAGAPGGEAERPVAGAPDCGSPCPLRRPSRAPSIWRRGWRRARASD